MEKVQRVSERSTVAANVIVKTLCLLSLLPISFYLYKFYQRQRYYQQLHELQRSAIRQYEAQLTFPAPAHHSIPAFHSHLAVIPNFLPEEIFQQLHDAIVTFGQTERTYLPIHKQGGTVAYETLHQSAPKVVAFFNSAYLSDFFSTIVGEKVYPTPIQDQSACSLLFYTKPGDHINWHYDHNFYNGRHFTVLLPIINQKNDAPTQLSSAQLLVKQGEEEQAVASAPNTLIIFEGAKVLHKVTRLGPDETRIMLSMTFATTPQASLVKAVARRIKDVAFFGIRALWT
jgi:hypothetical protein